MPAEEPDLPNPPVRATARMDLTKIYLAGDPKLIYLAIIMSQV